MSNSSKSSSNGIGFCGLLTIAFIVLKLCNVINWSWWWVLSPSWIPISLVIVGFVIYAAYKLNREKKVKQIMDSTGKNEWAAKQQLNKEGGVFKSRFQMRIDDAMEKRKNNQQIK